MSGGPVPIWKKYTTGSTGIWERIRRLLVLVPNRSSGNPLVPLYRVPPPGSQPKAKDYTDPFTIPAGNIIKNQYYKRDHRRNYPRVSSFDQNKISGLLKLGTEASPRVSIGDKGYLELLPFKTPGSELTYLSETLSNVPESVIKGQVLGVNGEAITAPNLNKGKKWVILTEAQSGMFSSEYPCRLFNQVPNA
ncbi:NUZM subunit of mitochondrial NADH:ubiquinone oxidoreductase [Ascoidea rubescens DSM 1968]|uniref:NUZM subunit of mitochondrial NADH:ubiquinone oxidoreductase n=1 Tax=Ascoidea rubescens DSM 1968 TaxID=1344418 RepID=A0A1D2VR37_9ASCO|nr:NUZM subunit of mitochondrial NADH:ubiquinone oxidoreductase [Ascoidea rubescens DSM 1968]ODV64074.1 NUZM subunit of mitochondrial NADH:ubiquinone oxidoreductase [Ascoidea rubescens DSM 1968]